MSEKPTESRKNDADEETEFYDAVDFVEAGVKALKVEQKEEENQKETPAVASEEDEEEECQDCGVCPLSEAAEGANDPYEKVLVEKDDDEDDEQESENDQEEATSRKEKFVPLHETLNSELREKKAREEIDDEIEDDEAPVVEPVDPYFIDEAAIQAEEDSLSVAECEERLKEAQNEKTAGNALFKEEKYEEALEAYTRALRRCPIIFTKERAVFYSNRSICFHKMKNNERCIAECTRAFQLDDQFVKPLLRRAECYQATDKLDEALEDYKKLCELEPRVVAHKQTCVALEQKIKERNEKLKEEMMGKLKDLGNMVLKPFGLSTNNFQFVQDPATGSYSVNFKK